MLKGGRTAVGAAPFISCKKEYAAMFVSFFKFLRGEDGAVTVDWVVLTAAVVGLGGAILVSIQGGNESVATSISDYVANIDVDSGL